MANARQRKLSDLNDRFLYQYGKNYVYCGPFSKKAYILTNENAKAYSFFSTRYMIVLSIVVLLFILNVKPIISIIAGVISFIVFELAFRLKFLKDLPVVENFEKPKRLSTIENLTENFSTTRIAILIFCGVGLAILIPINALYLQHYEGLILTANIAVAIGVGVYSLMAIIALIKKLKNK